MNISSREQQVIFSTFLDASKSAVEVGKELGIKPYTVRRLLTQLKRRGIISSVPFLNVYALGLAHYGVFFSLASSSRDTHRKLMQYLTQSQQISFLMELGGEFQYGLSICARNLTQVMKFLDDLAQRFKAVFFEKSVAIRIQLVHFGPKYLSHRQAPRDILRWGAVDKDEEIDLFDHKILGIISRQGLLPLGQLSAILKTPAMTIDYRLKRLRERGILLRSIFVIDTEKIGMQSYYLLLYTRGIDLKFKKEILKFCENNRNILFVVENLGSWDYEIGLHVEHARVVSDITRDLCDKFGDEILNVRALPVFAFHKVRNYPFEDYELWKGHSAK